MSAIGFSQTIVLLLSTTFWDHSFVRALTVPSSQAHGLGEPYLHRISRSVNDSSSSSDIPNNVVAANNSLSVSSSLAPPPERPKDDTFVLPNKAPLPNFKNDSSSHHKGRGSGSTHDANSPEPGGPKFDDRATQRALIVIAGLAFLLVIYFGIKFLLMKKKKFNKRYGRIESEVDLLEEMDIETDDEEEELFDAGARKTINFTK